jgi:hypothetical protein
MNAKFWRGIYRGTVAKKTCINFIFNVSESLEQPTALHISHKSDRFGVEPPDWGFPLKHRGVRCKHCGKFTWPT